MTHVDRQSPMPLYYQLEEALLNSIDEGRWQPGDALPSEGDLCQTYGVSRTVVRQALDLLETGGYVIRAKGKKAILARPRMTYEAAPSRLSRAANGGGPPLILASVIEAHAIPAGDRVAKRLKIDPSDTVLAFSVVHSQANVPSSITQLYVQPDASEVLAEHTRQGIVPTFAVGGKEIVEQLRTTFGVVAEKSELTISSVLADPYEATILQIPSRTPALWMTSLEIRPDGRPVALARSLLRADHFELRLVVQYDQ